jgi:hypothetical protein
LLFPILATIRAFRKTAVVIVILVEKLLFIFGDQQKAFFECAPLRYAQALRAARKGSIRSLPSA